MVASVSLSQLLVLSCVILLLAVPLGAEAKRKRRNRQSDRQPNRPGLVRKGRNNLSNWFCGGVALEGYLETQTDLTILPELTICTRSDVTGLVLNRKQRRNRLQCVIVVEELTLPIGFNLRCDKEIGWLSGRVVGMNGRSRLEALTTFSLGISSVGITRADEEAVVDAIVALANALVGTTKPNNVFIHLFVPDSILEFSVQGQGESSCTLLKLLQEELDTFRVELSNRIPGYTNASFVLNSFTLCKKCVCEDLGPE